MPSTKNKKLKDLHVANSMEELNKLADVPDNKSVSAKVLCKSADKLFLRAQDYDDMNDEENAYIFFVRYFAVINQIKKTATYKKDKEHFDKMISNTKAIKAITMAEKLQTSLSTRYDEKQKMKEYEELAKTLAEQATLKKDEKQPKENNTQIKPTRMDDDLDSLLDSPTVSSGDIYQKLKVNHSNILTPNGSLFSNGVTNAIIPGLTTLVPSMSAEQLYALMKSTPQPEFLILDIRPQKEYAKNHILHTSCINIPDEMLENGVSVGNIERRLLEETRVIWRQRGNKDILILVDKSSKATDLSPASKLFKFKEAIYKNDSSCGLKNEPLFLDGGFDSWLWHYPSLATRSELPKISSNISSMERIDLSSLDFPELPKENPPHVETQPKPINRSISNVYPSIPATISNSKPSIAPHQQENIEPPANNIPKTKINQPDKKPYTTLNQAPKPSEPKPPAVNDPRIIPTSTVARQIPGNQAHADFGALLNSTSQPSVPVQQPSSTNHNTVLGNTNSNHGPAVSNLPYVIQGQQPSASQLSGHPSKQMYLQEQMPIASKANLLPGRPGQVSGLATNQITGHTAVDQDSATEHSGINKIQVPGQSIPYQSPVSGHPVIVQGQMPVQPNTTQNQAPGNSGTSNNHVPGHPVPGTSANALNQVAGHLPTTQGQVIGSPTSQQSHLPGQSVHSNNLRQPTNNSQVPGNIRPQGGVGQLPGHPPMYGQSSTPGQLIASQNTIKPVANQGGVKPCLTLPETKESGNEKTEVLPPGWERCFDKNSNRIFYKDHKTQTTHWKLPSNIAPSTIPKSTPPKQEDKSYNKDISTLKEHTPVKPPTNHSTRTPEQPAKLKSNLRRSLSSPNLANLDDEDPIVDRSKKPAAKPNFNRNTKPLTTSKIDSLNPVRGGIGHGLTGLRNLGNTCYMNSVLQCLFSTAPLAQYFISGTFREDLNTKNPMGTRGELAEQFSLLVRVADSGQFKSLSPVDFKRTVGKIKSSFSGYDQQDSQEFLALMMDKLHEDINMVSKKPYLEAPGDDIEPSKAAEMSWANHKKRNYSIMMELFDGLFMSTVTCLVCQKKSVTFETFSNLTLPLPGQSTRCTLKDCINLFTRPEKMSGDDRWNCPQCKQHREAIKQLQIWRLPPILVIHLKRFQYDGMWRQKLQTNVSFPLSDLEMSSHVTGPKTQIKYTLYGVSNHYGTMHGGHYTAFCRNSHDKRWYKFDDQLVSEMSNTNSIVTSAGYLLFYTSIPFHPPKLFGGLQ